MIKSKVLIFLLTLTTLASFSAHTVFALEVSQDFTTPTTPSFPSCSDPQGDLIVKYEEGIHGIPGDETTHTGTDAVYTVSEEAVAQCYCTVDGDGVQTNWWKVSSLTFDQVEFLKKAGWIYIPDGSVWGLQAAPYMAQNIKFSCGEAGSGEDEGTAHHHHHHSSGEILASAAATVRGTGGQILGLAATGNFPEILISLGLGLFASAAGIFFLRKR